jgi:hypothetical protein
LKESKTRLNFIVKIFWPFVCQTAILFLDKFLLVTLEYLSYVTQMSYFKQTVYKLKESKMHLSFILTIFWPFVYQNNNIVSLRICISNFLILKLSNTNVIYFKKQSTNCQSLKTHLNFIVKIFWPFVYQTTILLLEEFVFVT